MNLSKATMGRVMAWLGLSFQKPLQRAYEQNGTLVKTRLKTEYPKIQLQSLRVARSSKDQVLFSPGASPEYLTAFGAPGRVSLQETFGK